MEKDKMDRIADFRLWLMERDINYQEHGVGHFQIYDGSKLIAQVWPSTEKLIYIGEQATDCIIGIPIIHGSLETTLIKTTTASSTRIAFDTWAKQMIGARILVTITELPSGALETQINTTDLISKYDYISKAYDDQMRLKSNPEIQILNFVLV